MGGGLIMPTASNLSSFSYTDNLRNTRFAVQQEGQLNFVDTNPGAVANILESNNTDALSYVHAPYNGKYVLDSLNNSVPRIVFGGVPTLEEAKEATSELKDALEMVYFPSSQAVGWVKSSTVVQEPGQGYSEADACVTKDGVVLPKRACQAFSLLRESFEAQSAVASVVSDENVWNAVIQNEKVKEFLKLQKSVGSLPPDLNMVVKDPFKNSEIHDDYNCLKNSVDEANTKDSAGFGNAILEFFDKLRLTIMEMLKSLSELFESLVSSSAPGGNSQNADQNIGTTIMALGVLALMVVVLKRGETAFAIQHMDQPGMKYVSLFLKTAPRNS